MSAHADAAPTASRPPRLALSREEAAESLGVSVDFFDEHVRHEVRSIRRGRRVLFPIRELERWIEASAERVGPRPPDWWPSPR